MGPKKVGTFYLKRTKTYSPSSTTQWTAGSDSPWAGFEGWDGGKVEVRIKNNTSGGVDIDMARAKYYYP
jgi:hypothetical protein